MWILYQSGNWLERMRQCVENTKKAVSLVTKQDKLQKTPGLDLRVRFSDRRDAMRRGSPNQYRAMWLLLGAMAWAGTGPLAVA